MKRVQHPHERSRQRDECEEGEHQACQKDRELELPRDVAVGGGEKRHQRLGEDNACQNEAAGDDNQSIHHQVAEAPRRFLPLVRQMAREGRDEGAAHGAFCKQVAHQIGDAKGDVVGIHRIPRAEQRREDLFPDDAQNAARHGRRTGRRGGAREGLGRGGKARRQACGGPPR
jgi:hypothetical protein